MKKNKPEPKKTKSDMRSYVRYSSLGFQMLGVILLGVWGGFSLDKWLETSFPYFTLILTIVAVVLAVYTGIKDFLK